MDRRNLIPNPSFETAWTTNEVALRTSTDTPIGTSALRAKKTVDSTTDLIINMGNSPVTAGATYVRSFYARPQVDGANRRFFSSLNFYDEAGTLLLSDGSIAVTAIAGMWQRHVDVVAAPPGSSYAMMRLTYRIDATQGTFMAGEYIDFDGVLMEEGDTLRDYFDGDTPSNPFWAYEWEDGVPYGRSIARQLAIPERLNLFPNPAFEGVLVGYSSSDFTANRTSEIESPYGGQVLRLDPITTLTTRTFQFNRIPVTPGARYIVTIYAAMQPVADSSGRTLNAGLSGYSTMTSTTSVGLLNTGAASYRMDNQGAWGRSTYFATIPEGVTVASPRVAIATAATTMNSFYLDGVLLEEVDAGSYIVKDYFDGSTPDADPIRYGWTAIPHQSSSAMFTQEMGSGSAFGSWAFSGSASGQRTTQGFSSGVFVYSGAATGTATGFTGILGQYISYVGVDFAVHQAKVLGWWDGEVVQPITTRGVWDGTTVVSIKTSRNGDS